MDFSLVTILAVNFKPQAYLDPGSGSIILQVLIAGLMGAGILIKVFWKKITRLFNRSETKKEDDIQIPK